MQLRAKIYLGLLTVAAVASGCHRLAPAGATVPTATLTGTVVAPLQTVVSVTRQAALCANPARVVPVSYATVQALDGRLQPVAGIVDARTDAGGHFALEVPAGRPYVLRVVLGDPAHHVDLLAVADPSIGDGAQLITVDVAMHVATYLLLDRTDGVDAALQSIGASDVQALVDAVRKTLSGKAMDLSSAETMDRIARQEEQDDNVEGVLSRVDQATSQAEASASIRPLAPASVPATVTVAVTSGATADVAALPAPAPGPSPASAPAAFAPTALRILAAHAPRRAAPDCQALAWEREFSWDPGPDADPFEGARARARVVIQALPRPRPAHIVARPIPAGHSSVSSLRQSRIHTQRIARPADPIHQQPRTAVAVRSAHKPALARPVAHVSEWDRVLSAIACWLPAYHLPDLPF